MEMNSKVLDNFGIVAVFFRNTGLLKELDMLMPKSKKHKITHGQAIAAMVMNMLKIGSTRLWKFPSFFAKLPVERLFGTGVTAEHINEYAIGETLDQISAYDESRLFSDIVRYMSRHCSLDTSVLFADTTNFSLTGVYEGKRIPQDEPVFCTFGPAKDQRTDLKRFVLNMMVTSQGIPVLMESLAGNSADVKSLVAGMKKFEENLRCQIAADEAARSKPCYVADAAFYSAENISTFPAECHWLTRVPAKLTEAKQLLQSGVAMRASTADEATLFLKWTQAMAELNRNGFLSSRTVWKQRQRPQENDTWRSSLKKLRNRAESCRNEPLPANRTPAEKLMHG